MFDNGYYILFVSAVVSKPADCIFPYDFKEAVRKKVSVGTSVLHRNRKHFSFQRDQWFIYRDFTDVAGNGKMPAKDCEQNNVKLYSCGT